MSYYYLLLIPIYLFLGLQLSFQILPMPWHLIDTDVTDTDDEKQAAKNIIKFILFYPLILLHTLLMNKTKK